MPENRRYAGWTPGRELVAQLGRARSRLDDVLREELTKGAVLLVPRERADVIAEALSHCVAKVIGSAFECEFRNYGWDDLLPDEIPMLWANLCIDVIITRNAKEDAVTKVAVDCLRESFPGQHEIGIADFGLLLPRISKIKCFSFAHGVGHFYRFRADTEKLSRVPAGLQKFLLEVSVRCPNELFKNGPRASSFEMAIPALYTHMTSHSCIDSASAALKRRKYRSSHEDVEVYMVEQDPETIGTEVPVWLEADEMSQLGFSISTGCLTGHIDVLRFSVDGRVEVWDFKPAAMQEKSAHVQVFLYALMLSSRTGLPLALFDCGYFDEHDAFLFAAQEAWDQTQ